MTVGTIMFLMYAVVEPAVDQDIFICAVRLFLSALIMGFFLLIGMSIERQHRRNFFMQKKIMEEHNRLIKEQQFTAKVLLSILPA